MKHENLFDQMVNITKASAYDVTATQVIELKQVIRDLIEVGKLDKPAFNDQRDSDLFKLVVQKAKILSI